MARIFPHNTDIVRFAYGEHLLRPTTPIDEVQRATGPLFPAYKAARDQANYLIHRSESTGYCKSCLTRQFHEVIVEQYNKVQLETRTTNAQFQHPARRN